MAATQPLPVSVPLFLHGLDSSIQGTKARWFAERFPAVRMQDYHGDLEQRLAQLEQQTAGLSRLILIGSSFGGLMATCFALAHPERCQRLVLLAPALNFSAYRPPARPLSVPAVLVIGSRDTVCPPQLVLPLARATFSNLDLRLVEDDHLLHRTFPALDWPQFLA